MTGLRWTIASGLGRNASLALLGGMCSKAITAARDAHAELAAVRHTTPTRSRAGSFHRGLDNGTRGVSSPKLVLIAAQPFVRLHLASSLEHLSRQRLRQVGSNYFRVHPKGVGILCQRKEGLPRLTFVEEYFGEVHAPWRWFEMQVRPCPVIWPW